MEAGVGIEPAYTDLQSAAWPLCHPAVHSGHGRPSVVLKENGEAVPGFPAALWSGKRVSNSRPQPWQGCALPTELFPHGPAAL